MRLCERVSGCSPLDGEKRLCLCRLVDLKGKPACGGEGVLTLIEVEVSSPFLRLEGDQRIVTCLGEFLSDAPRTFVRSIEIIDVNNANLNIG